MLPAAEYLGNSAGSQLSSHARHCSANSQATQCYKNYRQPASHEHRSVTWVSSVASANRHRLYCRCRKRFCQCPKTVANRPAIIKPQRKSSRSRNGIAPWTSNLVEAAIVLPSEVGKNLAGTGGRSMSPCNGLVRASVFLFACLFGILGNSGDSIHNYRELCMLSPELHDEQKHKAFDA